MRINGRDYKVQELDFNAICELEEKGVELLGMSEKNPKLATMVRGFVAWVMNVPAEVAAKEIQHHIQNGGSFEGIFNDITNAMDHSGFFKTSGQQEQPKRPQDFQKKKNQYQNRNNYNRNRNTNHSQR